MKHSTLSLATILALVGGTHAATVSIVDDFESYSPINGDMNGQGGWVVTNGTPAIPANAPLVILDGYTWDGSDKSATVGGFAPLTPGVVSLSRAASVPLNGGSFSFETAYTESTNAKRNNFSFVLGTNVGAGNLFSINLTPGAAGEYDFSWSSDFASGATFGSKLANVSTQFQLDTSWNGSAMAYSFTNAGSTVASGTFSTLNSSSEMKSFAVKWDSGSTFDTVGDNSVTIDNVKMVNTVPEPGSTFLLLAGSMVGLGVLRRTGKVVKQVKL